MSPINFDALRTGEDSAVSVPPDGKHQAQLTKAKHITANSGKEWVKTEWLDMARGNTWESWNTPEDAGRPFFLDLMTGLGIDIGKINTDDALADALDAATDKAYDVKTQSNQSANGDKWFINTYVDGAALGVQTVVTDDQLKTGLEATDVPIDTDGLPSVEDDDKIPF